jgi:hypothetical protein
VGSIGPILQSPRTLGLTAGEIGGAGSAYVTGAVIGALIFGWMTDRFGRRLIFYVTLIVYLAGVLLTATSWSFWSFALFRAITGFGTHLRVDAEFRRDRGRNQHQGCGERVARCERPGRAGLLAGEHRRSAVQYSAFGLPSFLSSRVRL